MFTPTNRNQTIQYLALQLRQFERLGEKPQHRNDLFSTGIAPLDELLPGGG